MEFFLFAEGYGQMEIATSLVDFCEEEIEIIKKCAACYSNADKYPNNWFTMTCDKPHLIVWARTSANNYRPAKAMSTDGQLVDVQFFASYNHNTVATTDCFVYSDLSPNKQRVNTHEFRTALQVIVVVYELFTNV